MSLSLLPIEDVLLCYVGLDACHPYVSGVVMTDVESAFGTLSYLETIVSQDTA